MDEHGFEQKTDEENYFVSMTDMMVGLVFIFIIMLMYYALQLRTQEDAAAIEQTAAQVERAQLQQQEETAQRERENAEAEAARAIVAQDQARQAALVAQAERANAEQEAALAILRQDEARRAAAVAQTEAARAVARQRQLEDLNTRLQGADATRAAILLQIEADMAVAGVDVDIDLEQGVLRLGDQVLFDTGDADLTQRGQEILVRVAAAFAEVLPCYADGVPRPATCAGEGYAVEALYIEGHTDNRPVSLGAAFRDNLALSAERATNTYRFMVGASDTLGALCLRRADDTCTPILGVSGYGDRRPIAPNDTAEGQALNRRIDFRIIMATPDLGQIENALDRALTP
ncbi:MAG: OmpA family protein [Bauldia sp.]|nr:OmpA family protein [Bauldia sp.]